MKNLKQREKNGFTLIEVITAVFIVMVAIFGIYDIINQAEVVARIASMQLTAAYLSQEGVEIVKNIRDSNYLKWYYNEAGYNQPTSWMSGLALAGAPISVNCSTGCGVDYLMSSLNPALAGQPLKFNGNFFNYSSGNNTLYKRKITVMPQTNPLGQTYLQVAVRVDWNDRGHNRSITVNENLYNWWQL